MASGRTHDELTSSLAVILPIGIALVYYNLEPNKAIPMGILTWSACALHRIYSPDVDVNAGYYGNYIANVSLGYFWGYIWDMLLSPLRLIKHRSILSHGLFIGTIIRLGYLYFLYYIFTRPRPDLFISISFANVEYFIVFMVSFFICDLGHLFLDYIWKW